MPKLSVERRLSAPILSAPRSHRHFPHPPPQPAKLPTLRFAPRRARAPRRAPLRASPRIVGLFSNEALVDSTAQSVFLALSLFRSTVLIPIDDGGWAAPLQRLRGWPRASAGEGRRPCAARERLRGWPRASAGEGRRPCAARERLRGWPRPSSGRWRRNGERPEAAAVGCAPALGAGRWGADHRPRASRRRGPAWRAATSHGVAA